MLKRGAPRLSVEQDQI